MHESSLAKQVLYAVLARAREIGAVRVRAVRGWIADTEHLDPSVIAFHFEAHARGTPAEGARLDFELRRVNARCHACGLEYQPDYHVLICPACGHIAADLVGRVGMGVASMSVVRAMDSVAGPTEEADGPTESVAEDS